MFLRNKSMYFTAEAHSRQQVKFEFLNYTLLLQPCRKTCRLVPEECHPPVPLSAKNRAMQSAIHTSSTPVTKSEPPLRHAR